MSILCNSFGKHTHTHTYTHTHTHTHNVFTHMSRIEAKKSATYSKKRALMVKKRHGKKTPASITDILGLENESIKKRLR